MDPGDCGTGWGHYDALRSGSDGGAERLITMVLILLGAANEPTGLQPAQSGLPSPGRR